MTEQVIFKIDKKLKEQAMKKAKREGLSLSVVLKSAARAYVDDEFKVGISYSPQLIRAIRQSEKEIREGKIFRGDLRELIKKV
ncbi:MAG: hypothetical protein A3C70_03520 [Candidatus Zambryskibacteria bacterium RIFCSPHIGHO2_02_FULL_43_14]|uniref:Ribbon-helix-helix protein CopG domain-containing protein n=1 Tax=Candidatus Zambryskibacteria bacterium RIFCSPHIGHO2_02_FULL_43_14 TaxID=1802748 RepID=A0A1G2TFR9_9BACT|nr:MAG: hypothetical protein A2829_00965 [Candidatus Zambryskibacteria bacterium RIFCSPHIGHO2_01_FULL_43_60]OHA96155.1 MAG: hypothetical protein A3C70_03520 [Candidatus Zambryskibacteria bacterium RIFCSPHIGHO2_02_FULL_43_14]OHB03155.1 MAG: hypothetical protein A3B03_01805 [Candidatus Zambryskibacteria bacterium RIFCSPLOWO2_01_FULL_42_41]